MFDPPWPSHLAPAFVLVAVAAALSCGEAAPTAPADDREITSNPPTEPGLDPSQAQGPVGGLTAAELLADPLLHLMLESLDDPAGAERIKTAIAATRTSLADGHAVGVIAELDGARTALQGYLEVGGIDQEDIVHLYAAELFLAEVAALVSSNRSQERTNHN